MAKGSRKLKELAAKLDLIVEVRDARAPASTSSPLIKALSKIKPVLHVLSHKDLADNEKLKIWLESLKHTYAADLRKREGLNSIKKAILKFKPPHREVRLAAVGIPNVGKSLLLNSLIGKSNAKVGNIPGITKSVSWYKNEGMLIVDSPGILDPHAEEGAHLILSWLGCAKAEVVGGYENAAIALIKFLLAKNMSGLIPVEVLPLDPSQGAQEIFEGNNPLATSRPSPPSQGAQVSSILSIPFTPCLPSLRGGAEWNEAEGLLFKKNFFEDNPLAESQGAQEIFEGNNPLATSWPSPPSQGALKSPAEILELIGKKYGCLISGGRVNLELAGQKFIEAFSSGRLGPVCLELPNEQRAIDFEINNNNEAGLIV